MKLTRIYEQTIETKKTRYVSNHLRLSLTFKIVEMHLETILQTFHVMYAAIMECCILRNNSSDMSIYLEITVYENLMYLLFSIEVSIRIKFLCKIIFRINYRPIIN